MKSAAASLRNTFSNHSNCTESIRVLILQNIPQSGISCQSNVWNVKVTLQTVAMVTQFQSLWSLFDTVQHASCSSSLPLLLLLLSTSAELPAAEPLRVVWRHVAEVPEDVLERLVVSCSDSRFNISLLLFCYQLYRCCRRVLTCSSKHSLWISHLLVHPRHPQPETFSNHQRQEVEPQRRAGKG